MTTTQPKPIERININQLGEIIVNGAWVEETDTGGFAEEHIKFRDKVWEFQKINDSQCRVWGQFVDGSPHIRLVTEIKWHTEDARIQHWLDSLPPTVPALNIGCLGMAYDVIDEGEDMDRFGVPLARIDEFLGRLVGRTVVMGENYSETMLWTAGPDDGKPYRQVEIYLDVTNIQGDSELEDAKKALLAMTNHVYEDWGVAVL